MQTLSLQPCTERVLSVAANIVAMQGLDEDHQLVKELVDWTGLAPSKVAAEIGVAATTITRPYSQKATSRLSRETILRLRKKYPDYPGWNHGNTNIRSEVGQFGDRPFEEMFGSGELPAIPVVGSALGMTSFDPERHIELTEVDMGEVLDHVARPVSLARDKRAYALTIIGESMWPRFRAGRRVIVSPQAPVSIGDDVIVQLRGSGEDRISTVLIKELVRRSASFIELRQFTPDLTFRVEADRVAAIHKVIGEIY